jgi:hypothetical protein
MDTAGLSLFVFVCFVKGLPWEHTSNQSTGSTSISRTEYLVAFPYEV